MVLDIASASQIAGRNAIARRGGHYGNLGFRGFREDQEAIRLYTFLHA